jgi:hypothetical protein
MDLFKLNLFFCACAFPSAALFAAGLFGFFGAFAFPLSLAAAFPIGGAHSACMFCVSKMLRDDPGYVWHDFKRKFRENGKQSMAFGMLHTAFVYAQIYLWGALFLGGAAIGAVELLLSLVSLLVFGMAAPYAFLLFAYIDLPATRIVRNSVLLSFADIPRSFMGALSGGAVWAAAFLFLPASLVFIPFLLLFGFSLSWLLHLMWIWPRVDERFSIEFTLQGGRHEP